jgi:type I restriction enzyme M protein
MDKCDLHTILRLPTGIFYAQGVKTNVLFFTRGQTDKKNTKNVWVYDLRTNMPSFGKRNPLALDHFKEFIAAFGDDPYGKAKRKDQGETGRFRCFTREQIAKRNESLDISWLQDDSVRNGDDLGEPADIAEEILAQLDLATKEMQELARLLGEAS